MEWKWVEVKLGMKFLVDFESSCSWRVVLGCSWEFVEKCWRLLL
jgi:hypothetical protein